MLTRSRSWPDPGRGIGQETRSSGRPGRVNRIAHMATAVVVMTLPGCAIRTCRVERVDADQDSRPGGRASSRNAAATAQLGWRWVMNKQTRSAASQAGHVFNPLSPEAAAIADAGERPG